MQIQATVVAEETTMPKNKKGSGKPAEDTQKLYARAYASRLAKQVGTELESSHHASARRRQRRSASTGEDASAIRW
jgi:hypothetical protein